MSTHDTANTRVTRDTVTCNNGANPKHRSAAQRQRDYRLRKQRAITDAIGEEASASRVALLSLLAKDLAALDTPTNRPELLEPRRRSVTRILNVIVTRYAIDLAD